MGCHFAHYLCQVSGRWPPGIGLCAGRCKDSDDARSPTGNRGGRTGRRLSRRNGDQVTDFDTGRIEVRTVALRSASFEEVLDLYGLHPGDKAVVRLALQAADVEATVTDDRLLWIVLRRCGHEALFLPDFVEKAVAAGTFDAPNGQKLLLALRPRLPVGFVEHSLRRLEGVI